jgi:uncharacterized protein (DUF1800 family)
VQVVSGACVPAWSVRGGVAEGEAMSVRAMDRAGAAVGAGAVARAGEEAAGEGSTRRAALSDAARGLLVGWPAWMGLGAAAGMLARRAEGGSPASVSADVDPGSVLRKLVERISFGATPGELARARQLGYWGYLEEQLNMTDADEDPVVAAALAAAAGTGLFPWLNATNAALQVQHGLNSTSVPASTYDATIYRSVFSKLQLRERMVEFWSDHFSIDINADQCRWLKLIDDRTVIRPNAMRSFEELVNASARSAAMLNYLDNDVSSKNTLNENYARELMELHTLSATGGYTQQDVVEVARCLTGWTWWKTGAPTPEAVGTFRYVSGNHDTNAKVLSPVFNLANPGQNLVIAAGGGETDGQTVINALVAHPNTAKFIATKLCRRFIGESCPTAVVDAVKWAYLSTTPKGDVKTMLRAMLDPNVVADAEPRLKRPFHLISSALRLVLPGVANLATFGSLRTYHSAAGHLPFNWSPPDGYPDTNAYWMGLVLPRWNFAAALVSNTGGNNGGINGVTIDTAALSFVFPTQTTRDQVVARLDELLFAGTWASGEKEAVRVFLPTGTLSNTNKRDALGLALSAPSFQFV